MSIVRNFVFRHTLTPNEHGNLSFAIGSTAIGHLYQLEGSTVSVGRILDAGYSTIQASNGMLMSELLPGSPLDILNGDNASSPAWRLVNAYHRIMFTGSSMYDGGAVQATPFALTYQRKDGELVANSATVPSLRPNSMIGRAKESFSLVQVPRVSAYIEAGEKVLSENYSSPAWFCTNSGTAGVVSYNCPQNKHINPTWFAYSGLHATASITIESRICVQYLVDVTSNEAPSARSSEIANQTYFNQVLSALSNSSVVNRGLETAGKVATQVALKAISSLTGLPVLPMIPNY